VIPSTFAASGCSWGQLPTALYNQKSKHPALPSPLHLTHTTLKPHPQTTAFSSPVRAIKLQSTTTTHTHNTMSAESWCAGSFCPCVAKRSATIFTAGPEPDALATRGPRKLFALHIIWMDDFQRNVTRLVPTTCFALFPACAVRSVLIARAAWLPRSVTPGEQRGLLPPVVIRRRDKKHQAATSLAPIRVSRFE
jgi:hypothetical protein